MTAPNTADSGTVTGKSIESDENTDSDGGGDGGGRTWSRSKRLVGSLFAVALTGALLGFGGAETASAAVSAVLLGLTIPFYAIQKWTPLDAKRLTFRFVLGAYLVAIIAAMPISVVLGDATALITIPLMVVIYVAMDRQTETNTYRSLVGTVRDRSSN
jgi:uncharacterized membrane protein YtjA (UPF0391 family)